MTPAEASFDERFGVLAPIAFKVAFRLLGDRSEAEEVAQEALARALARWGSVVGHDEPWVARVATNLAIGRWRRQRPTVLLDERHSAASNDLERLVVERLALVAAVASLPRRQRQVIALRYLADLPERDVAAALHTSVGSVKQHTHRALARLRLDLVPTTLQPEADDA